MRSILLVGAAALLAACGSGGGGVPPPEPAFAPAVVVTAPPVAMPPFPSPALIPPPPPPAWPAMQATPLPPAAVPAPTRWAPPPPALQTCFVPGGDCTGLITDAIFAARQEILVQAYAFTSWPIARALAAARARGVDVRAILDHREAFGRGSQVVVLEEAGVPILIDPIRGAAHNKVMVIDGATVITGSFNFSRSAQLRNAENMLVIADPAIARRYRDNWLRRAAASLPYDPSMAFGGRP